MKERYSFLIILFIITTAYYSYLINSPIGALDEGLVLVGAERVLNGEIPYKDFFLMYTPGQIYALAFFFKVFGISITTERAYDIIIKSLLSISIFLIIRFYAPKAFGLIGWAISLIWITFSVFPAYPAYSSLLFIYISIYFLLLHMKQSKLHFIIFSAISIVCSVLFRHDFGALITFVILFILLIRKISKEEPSWVPLILYILSGIIASLPFFIYFLLNSDITLMIRDLIIFPVKEFPKYQSIPYPFLSRNTLPFYVFPAILLFGILSSLIFLKRKTDNTLTHGILLISLCGIVLFNQVRVRSDFVHLLPVALTSILLASILLYTVPKVLSLTKRQTSIIIIAFITIFSITLYNPIYRKFPYLRIRYTIENLNPDIERAKYTKLSHDLKNVVTYIKNNTYKDEYIFVGVKNHDKLIFNHTIIYFLAERNCPTKYHEFNSGLTNTLEIQEEIINELKAKPVRLAVLTPGWHEEPNLSKVDTKIDLLDNYILDNFELKESFGKFEIWTRR
jgi:hypothetical protein